MTIAASPAASPDGCGPDPQLIFSLRFAREPGTVSRARHEVRARLGQRLPPDTLDDVVLVVSELVGNAVVHGAGDIGVRIAADGPRVCGDVTDGGAGISCQPRKASGLAIVDAVAERWGTGAEVSHAWFEILAPGRGAD